MTGTYVLYTPQKWGVYLFVKGEHYKMNTDNIDYRVSRMFGESNKEYAKRNRHALNLDAEIEARYKQGRKLTEQVEHLHKIRTVMDDYLDFLTFIQSNNAVVDKWLSQRIEVDKQIEAIQTERSNLWRSIKKLQDQRSSLG